MKNPNNPSKPIATRLALEEMARLHQSLIALNISKEKLTSNSAIVRTALYLIIIFAEQKDTPISKESLAIIKQLWKQTPRDKKISLETL